LALHYYLDLGFGDLGLNLLELPFKYQATVIPNPPNTPTPIAQGNHCFSDFGFDPKLTFCSLCCLILSATA
jgi:hypothetical protein